MATRRGVQAAAAAVPHRFVRWSVVEDCMNECVSHGVSHCVLFSRDGSLLCFTGPRAVSHSHLLASLSSHLFNQYDFHNAMPTTETRYEDEAEAADEEKADGDDIDGAATSTADGITDAAPAAASSDEVESKHDVNSDSTRIDGAVDSAALTRIYSENDDGSLLVATISNYVVAMQAERGVHSGMLQFKMDALIKHLQPLNTVFK